MAVIAEDEPLDINEEEKYVHISDDEKNGYDARSPIDEKQEPLSKIKRIRTLSEIELYLEHFVPQYTEAKLMTKAILFVILPLFVNVSFICNNFINHSTSDTITTSDSYTQSLWIADNIILYVEFIGLLIIFTVIITSYIFGYYHTVIDTIYYIKSWSTFRLFYRFRPQALYEYFSIFYGHHNHRIQRNSQNKHKKWKKIINELNREISNNNTKYIDMEEMIKTRNMLQKVLTGSATNTDYLTSTDSLTPSNIHPTTTQKLKKFVSWMLLLLICITFLIIGVLSLFLKLAQFSYLRRSEVWALKFSEYYMLGGFCNQLWGMVNYQPIRLDTIYKFIFMEAIRCRYSRFVADNIAELDAIIKHKLWQFHGWSGFMLALAMDWKMIYKIVFHDEMDVLSMEQCLEWKNRKQDGFNHMNEDIKYNMDNDSDITSLLVMKDFQRNSSSNKPEQVLLKSMDGNCKYQSMDSNDTTRNMTFRAIISRMFNQFTSWFRVKFDKIMDFIRMREKWKPLHPYTKAKYSLLRLKQKNRSRMKDRNGMKQSYRFNGIVIFEKIENLVQYIIPFVYTLTLGFAVGALIIDHDAMGDVGCTQSMDWNELLILYIVISLSGIIMFVLMYKCKSRLRMLLPGIVTLLIIATFIDGVIMIRCFLDPNTKETIEYMLFLWMFMISEFIFIICVLSIIIILIFVNIDLIIFVLIFAAYTIVNVVIYFLYMLTGLAVIAGFVVECIFMSRFFNANQHCIDNDDILNATFYDALFAVMLSSTIWMMFFGLLYARKSYVVCKGDGEWFGSGWAVMDGKPNKFGNGKIMQNWNVLMCISIVLFLYTHLIFVVLYYIDLKVVQHLEDTMECQIIFSNINIVSICCFLVPYCILIGYICSMNNNVIFWIAQLNVIRMSTLCCRDRIDNE